MLVEVDLEKPLPRKICFKGKDGQDVIVGISFPWLPPCCNGCSKWGHNERDCQDKRTVEILRKPQEQKQQESDNGSMGEMDTISSKKVVTALLTELEEFQVNPTLGEVASDTCKDLRLFLNNLSTGSESEK